MGDTQNCCRWDGSLTAGWFPARAGWITSFLWAKKQALFEASFRPGVDRDDAIGSRVDLGLGFSGGFRLVGDCRSGCHCNSVWRNSGEDFAEMLDESPDRQAEALDAIGASSQQVLVLARLPGVIGEVVAYTFYRFECAVRSSAVLGFLGIPTLGFYLKLSFEEAHFREVWSYLIALLVIVVLLDLWSHALRRRFGMTREDASLNELWRHRECSAFLRWSLCLASVGALGGLMTCLGDLEDLFSPRRLANLERFLREVVPYPLSPSGAGEGDLSAEWAGRLGTTMVVPGVWNTLLLFHRRCGRIAGGLALLSLPGSARRPRLSQAL